jgi:nucleotide-binding universal stress UspA family protein
MKLETILVPLDGSKLAEAALPVAVDLARGSGARLLLLRAAEAHRRPGADPTEAQVAVVREAESYLDGVKRRLEDQGMSVDTSVWYGDAPRSIVEASDTRHASLIVMSTHGRSGLGRLIVGSVAETVMRGTVTPILLIRDGAAPVVAPTASAHAWDDGRPGLTRRRVTSGAPRAQRSPGTD